MFKPNFIITPQIAQILMEIEALKQDINHLPITPVMLAHLRETAKLVSTRYSTYIEGNRLTQEQIDSVIHQKQHIPGRIREEKEVLGYYAALEELEKTVNNHTMISEKLIQYLHALVMNGGKKDMLPTPYRTVQNIIREAGSGAIVYLPPEARDVPALMADLVFWITEAHIPSPLIAAIAHYQFATIHPYLDGNGRTARLLATLILHIGGYGLKGIYSLEEYYAQDLLGYYHALDIGPSHNYYEGRVQADITPWIEYFCTGMLQSFKKVKLHALEARSQGTQDSWQELKKSLNPRQRIALTLFNEQNEITSHDIAKLFNLKDRTARLLCQAWVKDGFLVITDPAKKSRRYGLNPDLKTAL